LRGGYRIRKSQVAKMTATGISLFLLAAAVFAQTESACQALNDARLAREAAVCFEKLLASHRQVGEVDATIVRATLALARNRNWSGDAAGSVHAYEQYLRLVPTDYEATVELIQLLRYRGNYDRAETLCDRLLLKDPSNATVLALRSEILYWAGKRANEARRDAAKAIAIDPESSAARVAHVAALEALGMNHQAWQELHSDHFTSDMAKLLETRLSGEIRVRSSVPFSEYNDSDGIHNSSYESQIEIPIHGDHAFRASVGERFASAPEASIFREHRTSMSARMAAIGTDLRVRPGVVLSMTAGGWMNRGDSLRPTYNAELHGSPWDRWTFGLAARRQFLSVTPRAMERNIFSDSLSVAAERKIHSRTTFVAAFDRQWWSDQNHSYKGEARFERNLFYYKRFNWDAGALTAHQAYSRDLTAVSGFFTPDHYARYDGFTAAHGEMGRNVLWEVRGEGGSQKITTSADFRPDWAVVARMTVHVGPALWLHGAYERKNYSLLARNGWYQGFTVGLAVHP
jgi:hypothetical protein